MDATVPTAEALDAAVHRIRHIARPEAPYAATRGTLQDDATVLLVDTETLVGWAGWRCAGSQHLLAPLDVVRNADGHEAVLPDVRESVARACGRREAAGAGWRRGEAVTLLVSLVRGVSEAAVIGVPDGEGEWWIAADGRPMFAFDNGAGPAPAEGPGESVVAASRVLVDRIAAQVDDRVLVRAIDDVRSALDHPEILARRLDDLEEPLFDAAAPQPIQSDDIGGDTAPRDGRYIAFDDAESDGRLAWLRDAIDRHIDSSLGEALRDTASSIASRVAERRDRRAEQKRRKASRGRVTNIRAKGSRWPLVLAGSAAAAVVVAVGMMWPAGAPDARAREQIGASATPAATLVEDPAPTEVPEPADPDPALDAVAAAGEILAAWDACGEACLAPDGMERSGAAAHAERAVSLVDDYGAVALLEITAPEANRQLLVIERSDEGWRVRDLYAAPE